MREFLVAVTRNPLSLFGSALVTASATIILTLAALGFAGVPAGPYSGLLVFLILPLIFTAGLLLIPVGVWLERRRAARPSEWGEFHPSLFPVIDLNRDATRRASLVVLALSVLNIVVLAIATSAAVHEMETTEFCGQTCHSVMAPEY